VIDKSGEWWRGESFEDLDEYLRNQTADAYPAERVGQSRCVSCGSTSFRLRVDNEEGCAERQCTSCAAIALMVDSEDAVDDAELEVVTCPCGGEALELGVGFSLRADGEVKWVTVAYRCLACGVLGSPVDWKVDYGPTGHLFDAV